jgi:hypothetical protein
VGVGARVFEGVGVRGMVGVRLDVGVLDGVKDGVGV